MFSLRVFTFLGSAKFLENFCNVIKYVANIHRNISTVCKAYPANCNYPHLYVQAQPSTTSCPYLFPKLLKIENPPNPMHQKHRETPTKTGFANPKPRQNTKTRRAKFEPLKRTARTRSRRTNDRAKKRRHTRGVTSRCTFSRQRAG